MSERLHNRFTMLINIPKGQRFVDPVHGEATYILYRDWCECDRLRDHAKVNDMVETDSETKDKPLESVPVTPTKNKVDGEEEL